MDPDYGTTITRHLLDFDRGRLAEPSELTSFDGYGGTKASVCPDT
jgi:hypothetical protein